jgi:hypothetical protein
MQNGETEPLQFTVTMRVSGAACVVPTAVNFNDKFDRRGDEVADVVTADGNLAPELHPERTTA